MAFENVICEMVTIRCSLQFVSVHEIQQPTIYTAAAEKSCLTQFPLDKMAAIVADNIFKCIFLNGNDRIPIQISLKFVPRSPIDNKPALVQAMAWHWKGNKPLPEPMHAGPVPWCIYVAPGQDELTQFPLGQKGHHFADYIFRCIFVNEKFCFFIKISLMFVPKNPIDNVLALV